MRDASLSALALLVHALYRSFGQERSGGVGSIGVALYVQAASSSDAAAIPGYVERLIAVLLAIVLSNFGATTRTSRSRFC